ncbi:hypothetical protein TVAGG3_0993130 [Trichomonas vaginalis G3]|uniref:hypothetical protein n=1 Tax=Trichomonas vaginalis (strain ATCC PRA-98 / G3) TaxID=412133 RepID=UPI0021E5A4C0|nr:hypothetical protein TVAGG3_0993130 [Trichomonas vaginalis G3]KAI5490176.1 hypothetical protein TVAGG3_0993130 [Trichomonas vaginalis G3]
MKNHVLQLTKRFDLTPLQQKDIENWVGLLSRKNTLPPSSNSKSKLSSIYTLDPKLDIVDIQNELIKNPPKYLYSIQCGKKFQTSTLVKMTEELFSTLKESGGAIIAFPDIVDRIYLEGIEIELLNKKYPRKTFEIVDPITFISDVIRNTQLNLVENENRKYARLFLPPYEEDVVEILDVDLIEKRAIVKLWPRFIDNINNSTIGPAPFDFTRFQNIESYKCKVHLSFDKQKVVDGYIYKDMKFYGEFLIMKVDLENLITWSSNISDEELEKFSNATINSQNTYTRPQMPSINNNPPSEPEISIPETIQEQNTENSEISEQNVEESNNDHEELNVSTENDEINSNPNEIPNEVATEEVLAENNSSLDNGIEEIPIEEENGQIPENIESISEEKKENDEEKMETVVQEANQNQEEQLIPTETQIENNSLEIPPETTGNIVNNEDNQETENSNDINQTIQENTENIEIYLTEKEDKCSEEVVKTEETINEQIEQNQFQEIEQITTETAEVNVNEAESTEIIQKQPLTEEIVSNEEEIKNDQISQNSESISMETPTETNTNETIVNENNQEESENKNISQNQENDATTTSVDNGINDNNIVNEELQQEISNNENNQNPENISIQTPSETVTNEISIDQSIQIQEEIKNNEISEIHQENTTETPALNNCNDNNTNESNQPEISLIEKIENIIEENIPQNIEQEQSNDISIPENTENQVINQPEIQIIEKVIPEAENAESVNTEDQKQQISPCQKQNDWTIEEIPCDGINQRTETVEEDPGELLHNVVLNIPRIDRSTSIGDPDANISTSHKPKPPIVQTAPSIQIQFGIRPVRGKQIRSDAQLIAQLGGKKQLSPHEIEEKERKKQAKQKKLIEKMQEQARITEQIRQRNQKIEEEKRRIAEENERKMEEERQRLLQEKLRKEEEERKIRENEKIQVDKIEIEERKKNDQFIGNKVVNDDIIMREIMSRMQENKHNFHIKKLLHPSQESTQNDEYFHAGDIVTDPSSMEKFVVLDRNGKDLLITRYETTKESKTDDMMWTDESITFAQRKVYVFPVPGDLIEFNQDAMVVIDVTSGYCICIDIFGTIRRLEANQPWSRLKDHENVRDSAGQSLYKGDSVAAIYNRVRYKGIVDHTFNGKVFGTFWNPNSADTSSLTHLVLDSNHVYRIC